MGSPMKNSMNSSFDDATNHQNSARKLSKLELEMDNTTSKEDDRFIETNG